MSINHLGDFRNYNLLLIACESGNSKAVNALLKIGIYSELPESDITAQNLAFNGGHYDVVLMLLKANLAFPSNFDIISCSDELKDFTKHNEKLHKCVLNNNIDEVRELLANTINQKHYYNRKNESLLKIALESKLFDILEFLFSEQLLFGPHENVATEIENFNESEKKIIENILAPATPSLLTENHINIIMSNSHFCESEICKKYQYKLILKAFCQLNQNSDLKTILKTVAATKIFQVIFDFNADSDSRIYSNNFFGANGTTFVSGRIYIAAKKLLDLSTEQEVYGTIAHEFCHYALQATYMNKYNPYNYDDYNAKEYFQKISEKCEQKEVEESTISSVFINYNQEDILPELVVRPAEIIATYIHEPDLLKKIEEMYKELFICFTKLLVPAMEKAQIEIGEKHIYGEYTVNELETSKKK